MECHWVLWLQRRPFKNAVASVTDIAKVCEQNSRMLCNVLLLPMWLKLSDAVIIQVHAYIAQIAVY